MVLALGHILASQAYDRLYLENFIHDKIDNQLIDDQDIQETNRKLLVTSLRSRQVTENNKKFFNE